MLRSLCFLSLLILFTLPAPAQPVFQIQLYANGFNQPVDIAGAGDERLFIVEKPGVIRIIDGDGNVLPEPFLDIRNRVRDLENEQGLLGLVFHPDYADNGYFYLNYTFGDGDTRIARYAVSAADPDKADPNSEKTVFTVDQPFGNHNAGDLAFGPDGYLYIPLGDGGAGGDPLDRAQDRLSLLGKLLRIDVDNGDPYAIPEDNPFAFDDFTLDEIWALGLRNPWRFSFDRETGDLWIGDVGQDQWEEINFQPANSTGGENYGWRCYEGNAPFNLADCQDESAYTFPVHVYESNNPIGCSVTGGFVYRGEQYDNLYGKYIYADFCTGRFWWLAPDGAGGWTNTELLNHADGEFVSFGEDQHGELYVAGINSGTIYRVVGQTTSTDEPAALRSFRLAPNPAGDFTDLRAELDRPLRLTLVLRDLHGRTLRMEELGTMASLQHRLDLSGLPAGVYVVELVSEVGRVSRKVVRE